MDKRTIFYLNNIKTITQQYPERLIDVLNCFSTNQYKSKSWLVEELNRYEYHFKNKTQDQIDIAVLGGWYGLLSNIILENFKLKPIREIHSYDYDSFCKKLGQMFFPRIKFIEQNINDIDLSSKSYSIVINTACEHFEQSEIENIINKSNQNTLFVLQSNNYVEIDEHINCVPDLMSFAMRYKDLLKNVKTYKLNMEKYTRFMIIGAKQ